MKLEFTTRVREVSKGFSDQAVEIYGIDDCDNRADISVYLNSPSHVNKFKIGDSIKVTIEHV